jgi:hypothetical protein
MSTVLSVEPVSAITICSTIDRTLPRQARRSDPPFFTIIESPTVANRHLHEGWKHVYTQISRRSLDSSKEPIQRFHNKLPGSTQQGPRLLYAGMRFFRFDDHGVVKQLREQVVKILRWK